MARSDASCVLPHIEVGEDADTIGLQEVKPTFPNIEAATTLTFPEWQIYYHPHPSGTINGVAFLVRNTVDHFVLKDGNQRAGGGGAGWSVPPSPVCWCVSMFALVCFFFFRICFFFRFSARVLLLLLLCLLLLLLMLLLLLLQLSSDGLTPQNRCPDPEISNC